MEALDGSIVFLTIHAEHWLKQSNSRFNIPMANRLAKIIKIFDWDTDEGKVLLEEREKTGKWKILDPKEFKYVLKVYFPELKYKSKDKKERIGLMTEEVLPSKYPGTELKMFEPVPEWMLKDLFKMELDAFKLEKKS